MPKRPKVFLDTSVIVAALMSPTGGARLLFHLAQAGAINLVVGPGVLEETETVLRRKAAHLLVTLVQLLDEANLEVCEAHTPVEQQQAESLLAYLPDARVLAEALHAQPDWFVTHDKEHFLSNPALASEQFAFKIASPGDILAWLRNE